VSKKQSIQFKNKSGKGVTASTLLTKHQMLTQRVGFFMIPILEEFEKDKLWTEQVFYVNVDEDARHAGSPVKEVKTKPAEKAQVFVFANVQELVELNTKSSEEL